MKIKQLLPIFLLLLCQSCLVDDTPERSFEELPALTTEGAGMLAFNHQTESYIDDNGLTNVFYQLGSDGPQLGLSTEWNNRAIISISIITVGVELEEGLTLDFGDREPGFAAYSFFYDDGNGSGASARSNSETTGSITITHFDETNNIVSGTFSTEYIHPFTGDLVKITNGRFDTFFRR